MQRRFINRAENYTTPSLILMGVNLIWIFGVIWVWLGFGMVLITGLVLNHLINRLDQHLQAREAARAWPKTETLPD